MALTTNQKIFAGIIFLIIVAIVTIVILYLFGYFNTNKTTQTTQSTTPQPTPQPTTQPTTQPNSEETSTESSSEEATTQPSSQQPSQKTVKQMLQETCPVDPAANGKIYVNNLANYDDYLFSACKDAGTCDGYEPDQISKRIINMNKPKESCGSWLLTTDPNQINIEFKPNMGNKFVELTVKEMLKLTCPVDPAANGKINVGNGANYEDYLFTACKEAGTCDGYVPDEISKRIINMDKSKEHCGAWLLTTDPNQIKIEFKPNMGNKFVKLT